MKRKIFFKPNRFSMNYRSEFYEFENKLVTRGMQLALEASDDDDLVLLEKRLLDECVQFLPSSLAQSGNSRVDYNKYISYSTKKNQEPLLFSFYYGKKD